jgi:hypothetical protein
MDWIFMRGKMKVIDAEIITDSINERFPSDHYFVSATLSVEEPDNNEQNGCRNAHTSRSTP